MARGPDGTLVVAADGALIELVATGDGWQERRRLEAVGDQRFGDRIHHAWDGERLWISDASRHRVLVIDDRGQRVVASFGSPDRSGDSLETLDAPARIAAHGHRAVVLDAGNQRLVKLTLEP